jgi:two-component system sensor histidine kinase TctE
LNVDLGATGLEHAVSVMGSAPLIEGILNNLIDNALRYGRPAAPQMAEVTVSLVQSPEGLELIVVDNGPGLAPAECERLLQRGAQGHLGQGLRQGAGFGLSIVTRYAQLLGAQFWLRSPSAV